MYYIMCMGMHALARDSKQNAFIIYSFIYYMYILLLFYFLCGFYQFPLFVF